MSIEDRGYEEDGKLYNQTIKEDGDGWRAKGKIWLLIAAFELHI
jgi:hypothetical protein